MTHSSQTIGSIGLEFSNLTPVIMDISLPTRRDEGVIRFGRYETCPFELHRGTTMESVHRSILNEFGEMLPEKYHIEFYSFKKLKILHLNEDVIHSEYNPFLFNDPEDFEPLKCDLIRLYIVADSASNVQSDSQPNMPLDSTPSNELVSALLPTVSLPGPPNEDSFQNNIANGHEDDEHVEDQPAMYSETDSQNSTGSSNEYSLPVQAYDDLNEQSERAYFSHDVHPFQKNQYLTNHFKINKGTNVVQTSKGGIGFLQGCKTEEQIQTKKQVLALVRVCTIQRSMSTLKLILYAVYEEIKSGKRRWYKHTDKGFLFTKQLQPNARHLNPLRLTLTRNGDYQLRLHLMTLRDKQTKMPELITELDEQDVLLIHSAPHFQASPTRMIKPARLLCVLEINNVIDWKTIGLSNFISSSKDDPTHLLTNTSETVEVTRLPVKRQKTK